MMDGPQLCIVPATPVSGGGADRASVPFQSTLSTLSQGRSLKFFARSALIGVFFLGSESNDQPSQQRQREIPLHPGSPEQRKTMLQQLPLVQLPTTTTPSTYPLALVLSSLTTLHNNSSCSNLALGLIETHGIPIFFRRHPVWKMEVVEEGISSETAIAGVYFWRYPWWINDFGKQVFIS